MVHGVLRTPLLVTELEVVSRRGYHVSRLTFEVWDFVVLQSILLASIASIPSHLHRTSHAPTAHTPSAREALRCP